MILPHNMKQQRFLLIYSILILSLSVASFFSDSTARIQYVPICFGVLAFTHYLFRRFNPYGIIDDNNITKGIIFKKVIPLDKITKVKMFAGDIEIYSEKQKIVFDKNQIDKTVLPEVQEYFRKWILQQ